MLVSAHGRPCCSTESVADLVADGDPGKIGRPYCSADAVADVFAADAKTNSGANDDAWKPNPRAYRRPKSSPEPCARPADVVSYHESHAPSDNSYSNLWTELCAQLCAVICTQLCAVLVDTDAFADTRSKSQPELCCAHDS